MVERGRTARLGLEARVAWRAWTFGSVPLSVWFIKPSVPLHMLAYNIHSFVQADSGWCGCIDSTRVRSRYVCETGSGEQLDKLAVGMKSLKVGVAADMFPLDVNLGEWASVCQFGFEGRVAVAGREEAHLGDGHLGRSDARGKVTLDRGLGQKQVFASWSVPCWDG